MWSLGVEEQFYIFFPLVILLLVRLSRRSAPWLVLALAVASFLLNLAMVRLGNVYPAFYLLPTRVWELGAGAFLALLPTDGPRRDNAAFAGGWIGLALVVLGIAVKAKAEQAVGSTAAVIVGATLILWAGAAGRSQTGVSRLLGARLFVAFGLISYSLYLWHWPIIVLAKYWLVRDLTVMEAAAAFALMVLCAWASWRFVERPFRSKTITAGRVLAFASDGTAIVAAFAATILASHGFPDRLNAEAASINAAVDTHYRCPVSKVMRVGLARGCPLVLPTGEASDADVLLVGNSHAQMYAPLLTDIVGRHGLTGMLVMANTCLPSVQVNVQASCNLIVRNYLAELAKLPRARLVVLAFNWQPEQAGFVDAAGAPLAIDRNAALIAALDDTIDRLHAMGKQVMLIGPLAIPGQDIASFTSRELAFGHRLTLAPNRSREDFLRDYGPVITHFAARSDIVFARVDAEQCRTGVCDFIRDGRSLFSDSNHLAQAALPRFARTIDAAIVQAYARTGRPLPR